MLIDLLRHGEPLGGARYRGRTDDALTDRGRQQMTSVVANSPPWTHIISSPLRRCADFAKSLSNKHQLPLHLEPSFAEIDFGDWEGLTSKQILKTDEKQLVQYWKNPERNTPPNGETLIDFEERVVNAWNHILSNHQDAHLLIITHGGVLRIILSQTLSMPRTALFKINAPYACLSRFERKPEPASTQLIFHNGQLS